MVSFDFWCSNGFDWISEAKGSEILPIIFVKRKKKLA